MNKKKILFLIIPAVVLAIVLYYNPVKNSYLNFLLEPFEEPNWDEIKPRDIVQNSIPVTLIENMGENCKVTAKRFDIIIDHVYFVRGNELAQKLNYDREHETLILPCNMLKGETSTLNIWYVVKESPKHSTKYQYFITEWNGTSVE